MANYLINMFTRACIGQTLKDHNTAYKKQGCLLDHVLSLVLLTTVIVPTMVLYKNSNFVCHLNDNNFQKTNLTLSPSDKNMTPYCYNFPILLLFESHIHTYVSISFSSSRASFKATIYTLQILLTKQ